VAFAVGAGADGATHLIARRLVDMTPWLGAVATSSRDVH
jgi:error-prone DNA polymerase